MINLHWCNGIIQKNSTLCCYKREKHFPNMADWKRTVVKTSTRQRLSNFLLNVFEVDIKIPSFFSVTHHSPSRPSSEVRHIQQTDTSDVPLVTSCSSLFMFTFGWCVSEQRNCLGVLYCTEVCKEATAVVMWSISVCRSPKNQTTLRHDSCKTCCMSLNLPVWQIWTQHRWMLVVNRCYIWVTLLINSLSLNDSL